ncbi:DNA-3-methyladenine glycosylase I [Gordonia jinhuaensis]|uniref:DNA-3-methyladenine glycosylase I n=1 Tax=Gordonia jinhuaensis TaxID=1517702 RepID=A0A916TAJ2_9ACTN|nr:DNA-3-methyladenine glycosylase I [Gordonia jinhuaensis]GGB36548.1 DNA-3-methyladenine glycosylase I [Gordonia jinhuaensis]
MSESEAADLVADQPPDLVTGDDGIVRCRWGGAPDQIRYHDTEWGFPVADDRRLFEKVCLEGFQSGLSWRTILAKRENFRKAFADFDVAAIADFDDGDVERLVADSGIIRHRGKIRATINNARRVPELVEEFGSLAAFFWSFEPSVDDTVPVGFVAITDESTAMSTALKKRGWKFVGPTTMYALMQAMGLVNDHVAGCEARDRVSDARRDFHRPS